MGLELVSSSGKLDVATTLALTIALVVIFVCFRIQARKEQKEREMLEMADTAEIKRNIDI